MMKKEKKETSDKPMRVSALVGQLGRKAPFDVAEDWDNVGFLAGDPDDEVTGVVVAVNLGPEALKAAGEAGANVIVCHHPPIFKPVSRITRASAPYLYEAIRAGYSVIALHTNFDLASRELCVDLAEKLSLSFRDFLTGRGGEVPGSLRLGKFITYVPEADLEKVREAACRAGAGQIGAYSDCSFSFTGEGTFRGDDSSNPTIGKKGSLERVVERRLELVFPWRRLEEILRAAKAAHSYEEMAYDILELKQPASSVGYGFVAEPKDPNFAFHNLLGGVKQTFQLNSLVVAGPGLSNPGMKIGRVGFSPGSGSSFVKAASAKGVDVYICGEVGYHQMLEARQKGLTLVVLGHSYSERFFVETVSRWCEPAGPVKRVFEVVHEVV